MSRQPSGRQTVLTLDDFTSDEIGVLLQLAPRMKAERRNGNESPRLSGKNIAPRVSEENSIGSTPRIEVCGYDQGRALSA